MTCRFRSSAASIRADIPRRAGVGRTVAGGSSPCSGSEPNSSIALSSARTLSSFFSSLKATRSPSLISSPNRPCAIHSTGRRCPNSLPSANSYAPLTRPIPRTREPSTATTTSPTWSLVTNRWIHRRVLSEDRLRFLGIPLAQSTNQFLAYLCAVRELPSEPRNPQPSETNAPSRIAGHSLPLSLSGPVPIRQ